MSVQRLIPKGLFSKFVHQYSLSKTLRFELKPHPDAKTADEKDFILSPVADGSGRFFDSRKATDNEPKNADANGAYHIALKGLMSLKNIKSDKKKLLIQPIKNKDWFEFTQRGPFKPKNKKAS